MIFAEPVDLLTFWIYSSFIIKVLPIRYLSVLVVVEIIFIDLIAVIFAVSCVNFASLSLVLPFNSC